jgi:hypothetical protein
VGNIGALTEDQDGEMTEGECRKMGLSTSVGGGKSYREVGRRACGGRKMEISQAANGTPTEELLIYLSGIIIALPSSPCLHHKKWLVEMDLPISTSHNSPAFFPILDRSKNDPLKGTLPSHATIKFE